MLTLLLRGTFSVIQSQNKTHVLVMLFPLELFKQKLVIGAIGKLAALKELTFCGNSGGPNIGGF